jgi:hypothetical protein
MAPLAAMLKGPRNTRRTRAGLNRSSILRRNGPRHNSGGVKLMRDQPASRHNIIPMLASSRHEEPVKIRSISRRPSLNNSIVNLLPNKINTINGANVVRMSKTHDVDHVAWNSRVVSRLLTDSILKHISKLAISGIHSAYHTRLAPLVSGVAKQEIFLRSIKLSMHILMLKPARTAESSNKG